VWLIANKELKFEVRLAPEGAVPLQRDEDSDLWKLAPEEATW
jgi:hypothetical protein